MVALYISTTSDAAFLVNPACDPYAVYRIHPKAILEYI